MADLITTAQFEARTGRTLTASQTTQVNALIDDASALVIDIVNNATTTATWDAATPGTVPAGIIPVVVSMVRRGLDNPNGYRQESLGSYSYSIGPGDASGIFATRAEARAIRRAAGTAGMAAINLESDLPYRAHIAWLDGAL